MGEVQDALDRAMLETGVATITPEMAARDLLAACERGMLAVMDPPDPPGPTPPTRPLRLRVDVGPVGYLWLEWLGACARVAGLVAM